MSKGKRESVSGSIFFTKVEDDVATVKRVVLGEAFDDGTTVDLKQKHVVDALAELVVEDTPDELKDFIFEKVCKGIRETLSTAAAGENTIVSLDLADYVTKKVKVVETENVAAAE